MLYFKDKDGRVYKGLIRRLLSVYSPSLTFTYWYMGKGVFTKRQARRRYDEVTKEFLTQFQKNFD